MNSSLNFYVVDWLVTILINISLPIKNSIKIITPKIKIKKEWSLITLIKLARSFKSLSKKINIIISSPIIGTAENKLALQVDLKFFFVTRLLKDNQNKITCRGATT